MPSASFERPLEVGYSVGCGRSVPIEELMPRTCKPDTASVLAPDLAQLPPALHPIRVCFRKWCSARLSLAPGLEMKPELLGVGLRGWLSFPINNLGFS